MEENKSAELSAEPQSVEKETHKKTREPFFHLVKRDITDKKTPFIVRGVAVLLAFLFITVLTLFLIDTNPFEFIGLMFSGSFGTFKRILNLLQRLAILLCISLALAPAFKMKFWNIGAEGQVLIGGLACAACMICLGGIPDALLIPIMAVAAIVSGAIWALIPAFFKAKFGTNETLFTLMMNYVAIQLIAYLSTIWENPKGSGHIGVITSGRFPKIFGQHYIINILTVILLTYAMYVYLKSSKQGYEIEVVGQSENTARYIGINVKKVIIRTMAISGAVCGIAGLLLVGGTDHTITTNTAGGQGFTAIMVTWLAKFNPLYMILTSFLIVFLEAGASEIVSKFSSSLNGSYADIMTGIVLFFIIGSEFFLRYQIKFRKKHEEVN